MILTHSYVGSKYIIYAAKNGIAQKRVYINKLHNIAKNEENLLNKYSDAGIEVIYDSPLYISSFVNSEYSRSQMEERNILNELHTRNIVEYIKDNNLFIKDIKNVWNEYLKNVPSGVSKVLSLPAYNRISESVWERLVKNVPDADYKYISTAINVSRIVDFDHDDFVEKILALSVVKKVKSVILTFKTTVENHVYKNEEIKVIRSIFNALTKNEIEVILHHANILIPYLNKEKIIISIGMHSQNKSLWSGMLPFSEPNSQFARKTASFFSSISLCDFRVNGVEIFSEQISNGLSNNWSEYLKKIKINLDKNTDSINLSKTGKLLLNDVIEYKKIQNFDKESLKSSYDFYISMFGNMNKNHIKKIGYKTTALSYEKTLFK